LSRISWESSDTLSELGLGHRRDLVRHQTARQTQTIVCVGLYEHRMSGASVSSVVKAQTVIEEVESKLSS
jgi:hypothetical protein